MAGQPSNDRTTPSALATCGYDDDGVKTGRWDLVRGIAPGIVIGSLAAGAGAFALIKGAAPGVNPNFLPPPAVVGAACRRQLNLRLDSEHRAQLARPALPPPMVEHSPESRAKVANMVKGLVARTAARIGTEDAQGRTKILQQTNARFQPDMDDMSVWRRLGYRVGDREGEIDAA